MQLRHSRAFTGVLAALALFACDMADDDDRRPSTRDGGGLDATAGDGGGDGGIVADAGEDGGAGPGIRMETLVARDFTFTPVSISADPGDVLFVTIENRGQFDHSIAFELPDGVAQLVDPVPPGESEVFVVALPLEPTEVLFYCPIDDHRALGMTGVLYVGSPSARGLQERH